MKTIQFKVLISAFALLLLNSCAVNKIHTVNKRSGTRSAKELNKIFVRKNNGSFVYYQSLKVECAPFTTPHLLADGKIKIKASDILAYQTEDYFAISQSVFADGRKSFVTKNALPGFAIRVVKGSLNVYAKKYYNGLAAVDEYYIQSGENGRIFMYSPERMQTLISGHEEALSYFNDQSENTAVSTKLRKTAEIFNSNSSLSIN
jgi:hypothetical protein